MALTNAELLASAEHRRDKIKARIKGKSAFEASFNGVEIACAALRACILELAEAGAPVGAVDDLRRAQALVAVRIADWRDGCTVSDTDKADFAAAEQAIRDAGGTTPNTAPPKPAKKPVKTGR